MFLIIKKKTCFYYSPAPGASLYTRLTCFKEFFTAFSIFETLNSKYQLRKGYIRFISVNFLKNIKKIYHIINMYISIYKC